MKIRLGLFLYKLITFAAFIYIISLLPKQIDKIKSEMKISNKNKEMLIKKVERTYKIREIGFYKKGE